MTRLADRSSGYRAVMNKTCTIIATTAALMLSACGSSGGSGFDEVAVKDAIVASGKFESDADKAGALESFRHTCDVPDDSVNEYSVRDLIVNADKYPAMFVATARLGCGDKFDHVQAKIDNGDCFGGPLAGC